MYVAKVRKVHSGIARIAVQKISRPRRPFGNLPESHRGRWAEGLTAEDMKKCRWLKPRLVASIEYLEWTTANRLRHSKFQNLTVSAS
jgi:ATP-dependent DNA ligase